MILLFSENKDQSPQVFKVETLYQLSVVMQGYKRLLQYSRDDEIKAREMVISCLQMMAFLALSDHDLQRALEEL